MNLRSLASDASGNSKLPHTQIYHTSCPQIRQNPESTRESGFVDNRTPIPYPIGAAVSITTAGRFVVFMLYRLLLRIVVVNYPLKVSLRSPVQWCLLDGVTHAVLIYQTFTQPSIFSVRKATWAAMFSMVRSVWQISF